MSELKENLEWILGNTHEEVCIGTSFSYPFYHASVVGVNGKKYESVGDTLEKAVFELMNIIRNDLADWWMSEIPLEEDYEDECECDALGSECPTCEEEL